MTFNYHSLDYELITFVYEIMPNRMQPTKIKGMYHLHGQHGVTTSHPAKLSGLSPEGIRQG